MAELGNYLLQCRSNIVIDYLMDLFLDYIDDSRFLDDDSVKDLLGLYDENGERMFYFDEDFNFDNSSISIINESLNYVKGQINSFLKEGLVTDVKKDEIFSYLEFIDEVFKYGKKLRDAKKIKFITIPLEGGSSVLDNDVNGLSSSFKIAGKSFTLAPPHSHAFYVKGISSKETATYILDLLRYAEEALKYGDDLTKVARKNGKLQSEDGSFVIRDTEHKIRIQLDKVGENVVIAGIYYKDNKGTNGNVDKDVQDEYSERKKVLGCIKADDQGTIERGERAYLSFKQLLNVLVNGNIIIDEEKMCQIMFEAAKRAVALRKMGSISNG